MRNIADNIFSRSGIIEFAKAIGFNDEPMRLQSIDDASVELLGKRGTLRCFLLICNDVSAAARAHLAQRLHACYAAELQLFLFAASGYDTVGIATFNGHGLATLMLERGRVHASDIDALTELIPNNGEGGLQLALRHARALDRQRVGNRFFDDFRAQRSIISEAWSGIAPRLRAERDQLALLLLSRLMFLYFLQRRGFLCHDQDYFARLLRRHFGGVFKYSFYRGVLRPLFFGVLNRRPEKRTQRAAALGSLPYLNGGLFERHYLERRFPELDLDDVSTGGVFQHLMERYRFTASEGTGDMAVDPEMLGRVFEGLMSDSTRQNTGTFYTPAPVVQRMVRAAFTAHLSGYPAHQVPQVLRDVRVLDPACGSGAFLLGALAHISQIRSCIEGHDVRHEVVALNLHGVDLQQDAALLCALRLWLCLIPESLDAGVQPLPNLDRRIRQGDALVDPFDLAADAVASAEVRSARRALQPLVLRYTTCDPEERQGVQRLVARRERQLARAWLNTLHSRLLFDARELRAEANARDLFGEHSAAAVAAREKLVLTERRVGELRRVDRGLRDSGAQPFFSFSVHFADAERSGFDIILCNPPWVRSHNWPANITAALRRQFAVCRDGGQVDLAFVFLERAIQLLAPGGTLAIILPAKLLRSASAGAARALLLRELDMISIEDHSLDQRSIFGADAFAAVLIARRKSAASPPAVTVAMVRRKSTPATFNMTAGELSCDPHDPRSTWLLVPPDVRAGMQQMSESAATVASQFRIRRGVVTGANNVMLVAHAEGKLGDLAIIRTEGDFEAIVEDACLRPLVRGSDVEAWRFASPGKVIFCHDQNGKYAPPPKRLRRYLNSHADALAVGAARGRIGALQHVDAETLQPKVAWHDLADTLNAVVLPDRVACLGAQRELIPLNTVYFIACSLDDAHLLAAYLNSTPLRVFARAIAERAKDAHFRFFAGTVGALPLPRDLRMHADELRGISQAAHAHGGIADDANSRLDELVARAYGLSRTHVRALQRFDAWLRGDT